MTNQLLKALGLPAVTCAVFSAIPAHAAIFTATYTGTVSAATVDNVNVGDTAVISGGFSGCIGSQTSINDQLSCKEGLKAFLFG
ncbi:hypothetical protein PN467_21995 [Microcystis aeruginosa CS-563/04]|jgi:hypothetical protein|nr:hypothetical protein [Microcystis aeruginosa]MDB9423107.1 hypothetical protein [Microcystis aeruginosa CS-563/04]